jgi:hypothetical protein
MRWSIFDFLKDRAVKKITAIYGALIACVPLHISVASAEGIPVVVGPTDFTEMIREVSALQAQVDAMRASHDTTVSKASSTCK